MAVRSVARGGEGAVEDIRDFAENAAIGEITLRPLGILVEAANVGPAFNMGVDQDACQVVFRGGSGGGLPRDRKHLVVTATPFSVNA